MVSTALPFSAAVIWNSLSVAGSCLWLQFINWWIHVTSHRNL